jgi:hypothetical protein
VIRADRGTFRITRGAGVDADDHGSIAKPATITTTTTTG